MRRTAPIFFFILSLIVTPSSLVAQAQQKIDSLEILLKEYLSDDTTRVNLLNETGYEYWTIDPAESEKYGKEALRISEQIEYPEGIAMASRVIGVSYWSRGDFLKALTNLFKSQKFYQQTENLLGEANSTMNIGMVYADQKDYGRALENFQYANQLFEKLGRTDRIGTTYNKIGTVYLEKNDLEKAFDYLSRGLKIHEENEFSFGIMEAENRLGLLYRERKDFDRALSLLTHSLILAESNHDNEHTVKNCENIASVLILQGKMEKAEEYLNKAYPLAIENQYHKWLRDILKDYKDIYFSRNDYKKALAYAEHYERLKDSIFSEEKSAQIANLELEYQTAQQEQAIKLREQQILLLRQQTRLERWLNIGLIAGIILLAGGGYIVFRQQRMRYRLRQEAAERNRKLAAMELETAKLREEELTKSLEFKNKELTSYTVNFIRKNELIEEIRERLDAVRAAFPEKSKELNSLYTLIQQSPGIDNDWEDFKRTFENVHHNFFGKLLSKYPDLTQSDLRLCSLICLNLSIKEMASVMGISADSVKTARYRLRKKFNLDQDQNLADFVIGFS